MALTGSLNDLSLPDVIQTIAYNKKTGILSIKSEVGIGQVYFYEGKVMQAISPLRRERLGEHLMKKGVITRAQLENALRIQEERGRNQRIGHILLEMGLISQELNDTSLRQITEEAFYDLLCWNVGFFRFDPKNNFSNVGTLINPQHLLLEGSRRQDESNKAAQGQESLLKEIVNKLMTAYGDDTEAILHDLETLTEQKLDPPELENKLPEGSSTKEILEEFMKISYVQVVIIVGRNGSFLDCAGNPDELHFSLSALAGNSWGLLESMAIKLDSDNKIKQSFSKFEKHHFFLRALSSEWVLLVVGTSQMTLNSVLALYQQYEEYLKNSLDSFTQL